MDNQPNANSNVYTSWKYDDCTWIIKMENQSQYIYLLEGENYALLIDTAYGFGNLRGYVETLTKKPVFVTLTHGHPDHSGGVAEWEKVYMHKNTPMDMIGVDHSKLPHPDFERVFIDDGFVFDLGGRKVEVMDISAHSNGSFAFLDASHRALYSGDEIDSAVVMLFAPGNVPYDYEAHLCMHKANMLMLKARSGDFSFIFPSHSGTPISKSYIDDFILLNDHVLAGDAIVEDKLNIAQFEGTDMMKGICRVRWNNATFFSKLTDVDKFRK